MEAGGQQNRSLKLNYLALIILPSFDWPLILALGKNWALILFL